MCRKLSEVRHTAITPMSVRNYKAGDPRRTISIPHLGLRPSDPIRQIPLAFWCPPRKPLPSLCEPSAKRPQVPIALHIRILAATAWTIVNFSFSSQRVQLTALYLWVVYPVFRPEKCKSGVQTVDIRFDRNSPGFRAGSLH